MTEAAAQLGVGFGIALSGVLLPGPLLAFIILKSPLGEARTGPLVATGHILVELSIISLIAMRLVSILESMTVQVAVGITRRHTIATAGHTLICSRWGRLVNFNQALLG